MMYTFCFDDGRRILVHPLIMNTARASIIDPRCEMFLLDSW